MNKRLFQISATLIVVLELLSINAFLFERLMPIAFFLVVALTVFLSSKDLKYGLFIVFSELIIGSLGYLFWFDSFDQRVSIRIGIWLAVMTVWFFKFARKFSLADFKKDLLFAQKNTNIFLLLLLFVSVVWGVINGYFLGNGLKNIFLDSNGWVFFSLLFPILHLLKRKDLELIKKDLLTVVFSSLIFVVIKTFFIVYLFSHNFSFLTEIYQWIRDTRVGEITTMESGFVRVFFQSHIYHLIAFFAFFTPLVFQSKIQDIFKEKKSFILFLLSSLFLTITILSYSRSLWVGLFTGTCLIFLLFAVFLYKREGLKRSIHGIANGTAFFFSSFFLSIIFIALVINFPVPGNDSSLNAISVVSKRASQLNNEAGASSRWKLLPVLWEEVYSNSLLGKGFGATVTYISDDPRVRENNSSGQYTTFAFEWGWLDIWLKLGVLGLVFYLAFFFVTLKNYIYYDLVKYFKDKNLNFSAFNFCLILGLIVVGAVNVFTPYLNHPLGIGYILFVIFLQNPVPEKEK